MPRTHHQGADAAEPVAPARRRWDRITFASDHPARSMERTLGEAANLDLTEEVRDRHLYENGRTFFLDRLDAS
jgi:predicted TIM-barrel fold metal-dependent hydrolase